MGKRGAAHAVVVADEVGLVPEVGRGEGQVRVAGEQRLAGHRALARDDPVVRAASRASRGRAPRARARSAPRGRCPRRRRRRPASTTIGLPRGYCGSSLAARSGPRSRTIRARSSSISQFVESPKPISLAAASRSTVVHGSGSRRSSWNSTGSAAGRVDRGVDAGRVGGRRTGAMRGDSSRASRSAARRMPSVRISRSAGSASVPGELGQPPGRRAAEELELPEPVLAVAEAEREA